MANNGFSAVVNYFGTIAGLTPRPSQDGKSSQVAECLDSYGDAIAHQTYGEVIAPNVEYAVTGEIAPGATFPALGSVHEIEGVKVMIVSVAVTTSAGNPATVSISGQQVEPGASDKRTYPIIFTNGLKPRSKAQDVCGAFVGSDQFSSITTTFSVDPHVATVAGEPVASDASHARVEVNATLIDGTGNTEIQANASAGFTVTSVPSKSCPDGGYIERSATATKFLNANTDGVADTDWTIS